MVTLKLNMVLYVLCLFIVLAFDGKNLVFKEKVYSFYFVREGSIQITTVKICWFKCCFVAYAEQRMSGELDNGDSNRIVLDDDTLLVLRDKNLLIEREWLTLGDIIGKGKQKTHKSHLYTPTEKWQTDIFLLNSKWLLLYLY